MPTRLQRRRTKGWRLAKATSNPNGAAVVDRTTKFGNPFTIAAAMDVLGVTEAEARKAVVAEFGPWLAGSRAYWTSDEADQKRERILAHLHELRGKDLACPCPYGEACHADELIRRANMERAELAAWITVVRARVDRQRTFRGEKPMYAAVAATEATDTGKATT